MECGDWGIFGGKLRQDGCWIYLIYLNGRDFGKGGNHARRGGEWRGVVGAGTSSWLAGLLRRKHEGPDVRAVSRRKNDTLFSLQVHLL